MKTSTLFVLGLLAGAVLVFGIRAASLGESVAAESAAFAEEEHDGHVGHTKPTKPAEPAHETHENGADEQPTSPPAAPSTLVVRLDDAGTVVGAVMEMPGGRSHEVVPGGHAPMGDFPARIAGSASSFTAHLHPRDDGTLEVKLRDPDGVVVAEGVLSADDERAPENAICPVMGNPVDPEVYVDYEGRRIGFCCPGCDAEFMADPEKYLKKVDAELAAKEAE